jgi:tRNA G46 methylase TrmB
MRPDFLELMRRVAIPGARFYFGTDHAEYNEAARELFAATPWLKMVDADWGLMRKIIYCAITVAQ